VKEILLKSSATQIGAFLAKIEVGEIIIIIPGYFLYTIGLLSNTVTSKLAIPSSIILEKVTSYCVLGGIQIDYCIFFTLDASVTLYSRTNHPPPGRTHLRGHDNVVVQGSGFWPGHSCNETRLLLGWMANLFDTGGLPALRLFLCAPEKEHRCLQLEGV
jgi:hypothetical protein